MEPEAIAVSIKESQGYQLRVVQEVLLALLAKEASHGYQLRARLQLALGPLAEALNPGQVYVTLTRLEKAGLVAAGVTNDDTGLLATLLVQGPNARLLSARARHV